MLNPGTSERNAQWPSPVGCRGPEPRAAMQYALLTCGESPLRRPICVWTGGVAWAPLNSIRSAVASDLRPQDAGAIGGVRHGYLRRRRLGRYCLNAASLRAAGETALLGSQRA